jgi:hypothetical protein
MPSASALITVFHISPSSNKGKLKKNKANKKEEDLNTKCATNN